MNHHFWVTHRSQPLLAYFKGNPLEKTRQVIADSELTSTTKYVVDWTGLTLALETTEYVTGLLYDGLNRVRKSIYPEDVDSARKELVPTYNRAGALQAITFDGTDHVRHIAYNAKGQRVLLAMGNDMMTRYAYDEVNFRLLRIKTEKYVEASNTYTPQSGTTQQDSGYAYDLGGNILKITERITDCGISGTTLGADALDRTFAYDPLKRLLQATGRESDTQSNSNFWEEKSVPGSPNANHTRAYTQTFDYDKVGNVLKLGHQATGNAYHRFYRYTSGQNLLEQLDDDGSPATTYASFSYDLNGNQVTINTDRFFEWDAADQLRYFKIDAGGGPSVQAHYLYAGGDRVKKLVRDQQGNAEVTVYIDGVYEHRYRKDSGGTVTDEQTQLHVMDGRSRIATIRLGDDFGDTTPATVYNLEDHLGTSTTRLTDTGTVVDREEYYAFGESSLRTFDKKRYRYVGKELDSESGLYYYGARYYAAWVGRFISVDPLAPKFRYLSPYNYAANDPIGDFDIDGQQNNNSIPDEGGGTVDPMNFSDMLPKKAAETTKPAVVQRLEQAASSLGPPVAPDTASDTTSDTTSDTASDTKRPNNESPKSEEDSNIGTAVGVLSLTAGMLKDLGGLDAAMELIKLEKFETIYNGENQTWSLKFYGNQSVSADFVKQSKLAFLDKAAFNGKILSTVRVAGTSLNILGVFIVGNEVRKDGWTKDNKVDGIISAVGFIPEVGWGLALMFTAAKFGADKTEKQVMEWNNTPSYYTTDSNDQSEFDLFQQTHGVQSIDDYFK